MTSRSRFGHRRAVRRRPRRPRATCSKLSRSSSSALVSDVLGQAIPRSERLPRRLQHEPGSRSGASGTQKTPSGKRSDASAAACNASRVLPVPPGPVSVSRRTSPRDSSSTSAQLSLPAQERRRGNRQVRPVQAPQRRKVAVTELEIRSGADRSFSRCSPRSRSPSVPTSAAVDAETSTWPPWPAAAIRAARWTSTPTYPSSLTTACRYASHPHPDRAGRQTGDPVRRCAERPRRSRKGDEEGVALRVDLDTAMRRKASRNTRRCSASASPYPSAPSSCKNRVEPSTSVNRKVTVPKERSRRHKCRHAPEEPLRHSCRLPLSDFGIVE